MASRYPGQLSDKIRPALCAGKWVVWLKRWKILLRPYHYTGQAKFKLGPEAKGINSAGINAKEKA